MRVSYDKLWKLLIDKKMKKSQLRASAKIGQATLTKMNKEETVSMEVLIKICKVLDCDISDICEIIKEPQKED